MAFARVPVRVEQLPALAGEVAPGVRRRRAEARGLPPLVPQRTGAEHREELRVLAGVRAGVVEDRDETDSLQRLLRVSVHLVTELVAKRLVQDRHDVDGVAVVAAGVPPLTVF